jgi:hypothetical protein
MDRIYNFYNFSNNNMSITKKIISIINEDNNSLISAISKQLEDIDTLPDTTELFTDKDIINCIEKNIKTDNLRNISCPVMLV